MTTNANMLFVDTNILIYATDPQSPWHTVAEQALEHAQRTNWLLCISQQVVREYLSAATRATLNSAVNIDDIIQNIVLFRAAFVVLDDSPLVLDHLIDLVRTTVVAGRQIHDANIVATMQAHNLRRLLTHNTQDFARYATRIEVVPLESPHPTENL